jgi:hypothetical protein
MIVRFGEKNERAAFGKVARASLARRTGLIECGRRKGVLPMAEQNFSNHTRFIPTFHAFVLPVLVLNLVWAIVQVVRAGFTGDRLVQALTALALVFLAFHARLFALSVQDRIIRMEERQRFARLLPEDLKHRIEEFTLSQLVALRFAGDDELPGLARKVLNDKVTDRKAIKQMVQHWRADYLRA